MPVRHQLLPYRLSNRCHSLGSSSAAGCGWRADDRLPWSSRGARSLRSYPPAASQQLQYAAISQLTRR